MKKINRINQIALAENFLADHVNSISQEIGEAIKGLIGKKIVTKAQYGTKKFLDHMPKIEKVREKRNGVHFSTQGYYDFNSSQVYLKIRCCVNSESYDSNTYFCHYSGYLYLKIGKIEDQVLVDTIPIEQAKNVVVEDVQKSIDEFREAKELASSKYAAIHPEFKDLVRR